MSVILGIHGHLGFANMSNLDIDRLLVTSFSHVPANVSFIAQLHFRDQSRYDLILTPANPKSKDSTWSVIASIEGGKDVIKLSGATAKKPVPSKAFKAAISVLNDEDLMRLPCRIYYRQEGNGYMFLFSRLPMVIDGDLLVMVDKDGLSSRVLRGD